MLAPLFLGLLGLIANSEVPLEHDDEVDIWQRAIENDDLFGGDMLIPHDFGLRNAIADESYRWPNAKIPYVIDKSVANLKPLIEKAMQHYHETTCVRFVKKTSEAQYVRFFKGVGCYAAIGRNTSYTQPQPVSLGKGCGKIGTIIHELGHVLGFYHEQNRSDRDDYLNVYLNNVRTGQRHNFNKLRADQNILYNDFDYDSIMIYGNFAFSKRPNVLKTMEAKNGRKLHNPYEKSRMTSSDIQRVKKMYKCPIVN